MRMNLVIRLSCAVLAFLFLGTLVLTASPALGSSRIQNISLKKEGNFTRVTVYADKPFEFSHFTEEAKEGKPYRVIIDCQDAIFDLPQNNFKTGLPAGTIKVIRTSQYQAAPERIVRVVLDLKAPVVYKVTEPETDYEASITIFTAKDPDFALWVAVLEGEKIQKVSREKGQPELSRTEKVLVPVEEPTPDQSEAFLPSPEQSPDQTLLGKEGVEAVEKRRVNRRAVSYADTGELIFPTEQKRVFLSRTESEVQDVTKRAVEELPTVILPKSEPQPPSVPVPAQVERAGKEGMVDPYPSTERASPTSQLTQSPVFWGPLPKEETVAEERADREKVTVAKVEREKASERTAGLIEKGIGRILGPEPAVAKETIPAPDTDMLIQGRMESHLSVIPQRRMVEYNPMTDRDVFLPPTEKEKVGFVEAPLPLFENLKLVGILKDRQGNRALLEDEVGFGYILTSGERIKNGYVIAIEDDQAIFHVEEYGGYQIMVLELNQEY
jgi:hypothetical protein